MSALLRLDAFARKFISMCAMLFPFKKRGEVLYLCNEKIHSMVHGASEMMRWGSLINCSGEAAETSHKINVKGPGSNVGLGPRHSDDARPTEGDGASYGKRHPRYTDVIICINTP